MVGMTAKRNPWGAKLKKLRLGKDLLQAQVAELLGVSVASYRNWEQGRTAPPAYARSLIEQAIKAYGS